MMKEQKGITLVALIITIIVMLILVGVSISVALNGGLFDKAEAAKSETNQKQVEEVVSIVLANYNAEKRIEGTEYQAPDATAFSAEIKTMLSEATVAAVTTTDGDTLFSVTNQGKTVYANVTDFTQTTVNPAETATPSPSPTTTP